MPFPLHKVPRGLLELLRLRTLGANPPLFSETVVPIVDATEFYAADLVLASTGLPTVGSIAAPGMIEDLTLTAPVRLLSAGARLTIGAAAATNVLIRVQLIDTRTNEGASLCQTFYPAVPAGASCVCSAIVSPPWVLEPNWILRAVAWGTAAGVDHSLEVVATINNITGI